MVPVRRERLFLLPGDVAPYEAPDGAPWFPSFRVHQRVEPGRGHAYRLEGAPFPGEAVRGLRVSREPFPPPVDGGNR